MTYNVDEHQSDNHYNSPLVAYYPEVIAANMDFDKAKFTAKVLNDNSIVHNMEELLPIAARYV